MSGRLAQAHRISDIQIFGAIFPKLTIESILDPDYPNQLRLHTWDRRKYATGPSILHGGHTYRPASIGSGLAQNVRFPAASKPFGSTPKLCASMLEFLSRFAQLLPDAAALVVAFALASWFADCVPVAPLLYLLGPDNEATLLLRLLGCLCRRPILLSDIDIAALRTLPSRLDATLLINQRSLARHVTRVLLASNNRHFRMARGSGELHAYGAKAFSANLEFVNGNGVRVSLSPAQNPLTTLTDADEKEMANEFQSMLLRYRMVNHQRVGDAQLDTRDFVPAMREEVRTWLAPICDCPDLQKSVRRSLLQQSRDAEGDRLSDDRCMVAEAALFFCHKPDTGHYFIRDLAERVND